MINSSWLSLESLWGAPTNEIGGKQHNLSIVFREYCDDGTLTPDYFVPVAEPPVTAEAVAEGEVLVELVYVSVDPYMRGQMRNVKGYFASSFCPGQPPEGLCIARVTHSKAQELLPEGCLVSGSLPWRRCQVLGKERVPAVMRLDASPDVPLTAYMGPLGMVGATAYCSLIKIAKPKAGDRAFISGAAGAVGYIVGQLLKNVYGCHVVGSAGSDDKVAFLQRIGFDEAFNYKQMGPREALPKYCPEGIDIYFDNVGGETLEAALECMNQHGRIVGCGAISQYDSAPEKRYGVKNLFLVVTKRLLFEGFIVSDYMSEMRQAFQSDMLRYVKEGKVSVEVHVEKGLESVGKAFCGMMAGQNIGKMVVQV